uniref:cytochrome c oxidase assembly factor 8-like n=1 Tax=Myxine glutinosa TaxID=7769 RepID=UPI0035900611
MHTLIRAFCGSRTPIRLGNTLSCRFSAKIEHQFSPPSGSVRDWVGPPDCKSNLRPVIPYISPKESDLERSLRHLRMDTQDWNQRFWSTNNKSYVRAKQDFELKRLEEKGLRRWNVDGTRNRLSADEMGEFFELFLDANYMKHLEYNKWV